MSAAQKIIDKKTLQTLVPFNALSPVHFNEVAQKTVVEEVRAGRLVFKEGDRDNQSVYLLSGELSLLAGKDVVGAVSAGSNASRHPIAHQQPRQVAARAKTNVVVARVDSSLLDIMLTWDQSSGYEVSEIDDDDDDDWMTRILQSQAFLKLPPSNIQSLLMRVETVPVSAGDVVIRQGGEGDYFYIIKQGRCMVTRKPSANAKEVKLAELTNGDAFGEDALVSDAKRNATITMMTDGALMRLAKKDFVELLREPLLNKLNYAGAAAKAAKGAVWLDVRLPGEFENVHIPDSRNIPLSALRLEANGLSAAHPYIVCCDTGRRSASAAFVLSQRGFEVYVLSDGLAGVPPEALAGASRKTIQAEADSAVDPAAAAVVALKPSEDAAAASIGADDATTADDGEAVAALQEQIAALQAEKDELENRRTRLDGRVEELREELDRVRDEAREQILELEQILATARADAATAQAAAEELRASVGAQLQETDSVRGQSQSLEAELAELRAREQQLNTEAAALQSRVMELESAGAEQARQRADVDAERIKLQEEVALLRPQAQQAEERLARIETLEDALQAVQQQTGEVQAEQTRRIQELEAALERAQREAERQLADQVTTHAEALAQVQATVTQRTEELQTRLDEQATSRAELEAKLAAVQTAQTEQQAAAQSAIAALTVERDALCSVQGESAQAHEELQQRLAEAQARIEGLQADAGAQMTQLEAALADLRGQYEAGVAEQEALRSERDRLVADRSGAEDALEQARARIRELEASAGEQVQHLEAALEQAREELRSARDQGAQAASGQEDLRNELTAARVRMTELETAEAAQTQAVEVLQQQLAATQAAAGALESEQATTQAAVQELEARLAEAERAKAEAQAERQSEGDALRAQIADLAEVQTKVEGDAEQRFADVEAKLAAAKDDAQRALAERERALSELQERHAAAEQALTEVRAQLEQSNAQQADAASSQDEQLQALAQLRDELHTAQVQVQESDAARAEIEVRLSEMSAAAQEAQAARERLEAEQSRALSEAEQRVRGEAEQQLRELRSELDGARAALARAQSERENLAQAAESEYADARVETEKALAEAQMALEEREHALTQSQSAQQSLETQLADARAVAEAQQQALNTELEQLRFATTTDIEAMQRQLVQLKDDLKAARKLSAGEPADEELERLRLLLDEAREEAHTARANADQWREQALAEAAPTQHVTDEMAAMQVQLADIQVRVDEALHLRDLAQQEVAQLRQELQTQQQRRPAGSAQSAQAAASLDDSAQRRAGLWWGLVAGLVLGIVGAGGALWVLPVSTESTEANAAPITATQPASVAPTSAVVKPVARVSAAPKEPAPTSDRQSAPVRRELYDALSDGSRGPQLIEIPSAKYAMGSGVSSLDADERPKHDVTLARFAVGKFEVTFDEYDLFARVTGRALPDDKGRGRGNRPVVNVSWEEAVAYAQWLSEQTGARYRLPTEAEWEYVSGGGARSLYWWGNTPGEGRANCFNCGSEWDAELPASVGSFPANPLGLHDTAGNVAEWVQDCYHSDYNGAPVDGSAWVTVGCTRRVVRGGGFNSPANTLRITKRDQQLASMRVDDLGFRVVREF